jgi:hypothetical protein
MGFAARGDASAEDADARSAEALGIERFDPAAEQRAEGLPLVGQERLDHAGARLLRSQSTPLQIVSADAAIALAAASLPSIDSSVIGASNRIWTSNRLLGFHV